MIATEIARAIDKGWDPDRESLEAFLLRRFPQEKAVNVVQALEICVEIFNADEAYEGQP